MLSVLRLAMKFSAIETALFNPSSDNTAVCAFSKVCVLSVVIFACAMSVSGFITVCCPAGARKDSHQHRLARR